MIETLSACSRRRHVLRREKIRAECVQLAVEPRSMDRILLAITLRDTLMAEPHPKRITQRSATLATTSFIREVDNDPGTSS